MKIKSLKREKIRRNQRKMIVSGAGLRNTFRIIAEKAEEARRSRGTI